MANPASYFGFKPMNERYARIGKAYIASGYGTDIFSGQPVIDSGTSRRINAVGAATDAILGVFIGCRYTDASGQVQFKPYWPASTATLNAEDAVAMIWDDPNQLFVVRSSSTVAAADIGLLADVVNGTGNTRTGRAGSSIGATGGQQFRINGLFEEDFSDNAYGQYAQVYGKFHSHVLAGDAATVAA